MLNFKDLPKDVIWHISTFLSLSSKNNIYRVNKEIKANFDLPETIIEYEETIADIKINNKDAPETYNLDLKNFGAGFNSFYNKNDEKLYIEISNDVNINKNSFANIETKKIKKINPVENLISTFKYEYYLVLKINKMIIKNKLYKFIYYNNKLFIIFLNKVVILNDLKTQISGYLYNNVVDKIIYQNGHILLQGSQENGNLVAEKKSDKIIDVSSTKDKFDPLTPLGEQIF